jgi:hypothetical protein
MFMISTFSESVAAENGMPLTPEAQQLLKEGIKAALNRDYRAAIGSFEEGRKTAPFAPELLFNLGLAESKIPGRELAAMVWFKFFLAVSPETPEAQKVRDLCGRLDSMVVWKIKELIDQEEEMHKKVSMQNDEPISEKMQLPSCCSYAGSGIKKLFKRLRIPQRPR